MPRRNDFDEQPTDVAAPLATRYDAATRSYHFDDAPKRPPRDQDEPAERPGVTRA